MNDEKSPPEQIGPKNTTEKGAANAAPTTRKPVKSKKLDRTLRELEGAFASWESLNEEDPDADLSNNDAQEQQKADDAFAKAQKQEQKFRKRTRQLLHQLREQLADLSED